MDFRQQRLSLEEAKATDMVSYLSSLGYEPVKIRNNDYWYLSPLRSEKTASFKINRKLNLWYDHGLGKGGTLIDFALHYHQCSIGEFLAQLNTVLLPQRPVIPTLKMMDDPEQKLKVLGDFKLSSSPLINYLKHRHIPLQLAQKHCREVRYELKGKSYFGIGFKNDSGGFEIRNPYFKGSSSPKDLTTLRNGSDQASVFEGFFDFLSYKTIYQNLPESSHDLVVLNTLSFLEKARPFMEEHKAIHLYLDRDTAGQNCSQHALSTSDKYTDQSHLYKEFKDLNEWLSKASGAKQKSTLKNRLR